MSRTLSQAPATQVSIKRLPWILATGASRKMMRHTKKCTSGVMIWTINSGKRINRMIVSSCSVTHRS
jgi:hypothetical protein